MAIAVKGISAVWVYVTHWGRALEFYTRTLGLRLRFEAPNEWAELSAGDGQPLVGLHVYRGGGEVPKHGGATISFEVDSLETQLAELVKRGVPFVAGREGHDANGVQEIPGYGRLATVFDPDGNRLQLFQPLRG